MRRLPAPFRILGQAASHQALEGGRSQRLQGRERRRLRGEDGRDEARLALPLERPAARRHLVEHGAEGEQVAARVGRLPLELLRCHVLHRPDHRPFGGQRAGVRRCGREAGDPRRRFRVSPRQPEVEELGAGAGQHDVAGLEVAVDDPLPVRRVERAGDLDRVAQHLLRREGPFSQAIGQRLAIQELHHQVINAVLLADIEEATDVRMGKARDNARFPLEPLPPCGILRDGIEQDLDRDDPFEPRVPGPVHVSHPAGACRRQDLVRPEHRAWGKGHAWPGL